MSSLRKQLFAMAVVILAGGQAQAACCYFSAKNADILQPSQKVFITWDPAAKLESFTVQPKFEGNALDFGMVIPTPSQPKLHEMPRDFFKHLAVYTILKKREFPRSKLLPMPPGRPRFGGGAKGKVMAEGGVPTSRPPAVVVLEAGVVGSLDYKIIAADRADDLFGWLKDNKYHYAGDEATLAHYIQKKWLFTVMKIDTMQMKKNKDGSFLGEVTPTRFQFRSEELVYPLKITQISVKDKTEALFYVQAPQKMDLPGDMSYQYNWVPMLQAASGCTPGGLPGRSADWLKAIDDQIPAILKRGQELGFTFTAGRRPRPTPQGRIPTTMEWSRRLTAADIKVLQGQVPYTETVPNVDEGFTRADINDPQKREAVIKAIQARLAKSRQERPIGYLVRHAPADDIKNLRHLAGHLHEGQVITKFRKTFTRAEMNEDLHIVPARRGQHEDSSEYEEMLPTSPP
jgi:hypothetical protein